MDTEYLDVENFTYLYFLKTWDVKDTEIGVSKPEVLFIKDENGKLMEPMERVIVNCPEVYSGTVINKLNLRKAMMEAMEIEGDYVK